MKSNKGIEEGKQERIAFAIHGSGDIDEVASQNNSFNLTTRPVMVCA